MVAFQTPTFLRKAITSNPTTDIRKILDLFWLNFSGIGTFWPIQYLETLLITYFTMKKNFTYCKAGNQLKKKMSNLRQKVNTHINIFVFSVRLQNSNWRKSKLLNKPNAWQRKGRLPLSCSIERLNNQNKVKAEYPHCGNTGWIYLWTKWVLALQAPIMIYIVK